MKVVVLAAGLSTRLRSVTGDIPKVLTKLNGTPIIEYVINSLSHQGYTDIIVTTHYMHDMIVDALGSGERFGVHISYEYEPVLLDTAGSLKRIAERLQEDFLVCGGSFLIPGLNLKELEAYHKEKSSLVTIVLSRCDNPQLLGYYGQAVLGSEGRIVSFVEKPHVPISDLIHTTYQIISPGFLEYIESDRKISIPEVTQQLIQEKKAVYGFITENRLLNISSLELYSNTQDFFCKNQRLMSLLLKSN